MGITAIPLRITTIHNIREAKAPNHSFLLEIAATTQEAALEELARRYPWYDTHGGFAFWLEREHGGSLWVPADWQRSLPSGQLSDAINRHGGGG